jgi:spore coat protein CotH
VLTTTFDDNSHLRQRLAYHLWNVLDESHVQIGAFNAVLFLDGEYQGIYLVSDHIDDELMEAHGFSDDGNLYKARSHNANLGLTNSSDKPKKNVHAGYTKEEGEPEHGQRGAYDDLDELITWIDTASDADFREGLGARLAVEEFEAWWIFVLAIHANDSAGKNSYLYHDPRPDAPDGRFHYIPWDFNASFGQGYRTNRVRPSVILDAAKRNRLFERMLADPQFGSSLYARLDDVLQTAYAVDKVIEELDTWIDEIGAAARRDEDKWSERYRKYWDDRDPTPEFAVEVEYVREWIQQHWVALGARY